MAVISGGSKNEDAASTGGIECVVGADARKGGAGGAIEDGGEKGFRTSTECGNLAVADCLASRGALESGIADLDVNTDFAVGVEKGEATDAGTWAPKDPKYGAGGAALFFDLPSRKKEGTFNWGVFITLQPAETTSQFWFSLVGLRGVSGSNPE